MKKMIIIWVVIAVMLVGTLTFIGLQFQNSVKPYRAFEKDLIESAQIYMQVNKINLDVKEQKKLTIEQLINEKYLESNEVGEDTCTGYINIEKTYSDYEYYPFIKCEDYTTTDYEEK